ncbi:hypothetical protein AMJ52_02450 [candidate division TA06 bacterium DG_78]|uniref:DUF4242 domain-containing protein n=1 Tax=candidate division TA06 bacterium DG_78 TaxID=1703772 RepID=A0A0S7YGS3_UNCT6|nr:MAG: hypothetical protein AMJ52_02450 [candidate division TA06 bacterium DG_78]
MAKVIEFHFTENGRLPKIGSEQVEGFKKKFSEILKEYPDVKYNGTYVNEEGMGICDWEAPNADVVKEIVTKALGAPPADPIIVVNRVM